MEFLLECSDLIEVWHIDFVDGAICELKSINIEQETSDFLT